MIIRTILKILLGVLILYKGLFLYYMFRVYLLNPYGDWRTLTNICCEIIQKVPIYIHIIGGSIISIFGPIQLLRFIIDKQFLYSKLEYNRAKSIDNIIKRIHIFIGLIYYNGFILAASGGLMFINRSFLPDTQNLSFLEDATIGGIWMTIPFTIYGFLMLIYPTIAIYHILKGNHKLHQDSV